MKNLLTLLRIPHLRAQMRLNRDFESYARLNFLYSAFECGLLQALESPVTRETLLEKLQAQRAELLDALLRVGVSLKELSCRGGLYGIRGKCSRALVAGGGDQIAGMVQEHVAYHGSVYRHLRERLKGAPLGDYLEQTASIVARSSRMLEPFTGAFAASVVRKTHPAKMLEIGCGSGIYLKYTCEESATVTGIAIDLQEKVVEQAERNLRNWGISERFEILAADIRAAHPALAGPFDLITLYNNIYYFERDQRPVLFRELRARLAPNGGLALVSLMKGPTINSTNFDVVLQSTVGCAPLPGLDELVAQLKKSGFRRVEKTKLIPLEPYYGILAR